MGTRRVPPGVIAPLPKLGMHASSLFMILAVAVAEGSRLRGGREGQDFRRSSSCCANGFANETVRDRGDGAACQRRRPATRLVGETDGHARDVKDARRMSHNPEVAGSNPAPATKKHQVTGLIASHGGQAC